MYLHHQTVCLLPREAVRGTLTTALVEKSREGSLHTRQPGVLGSSSGLLTFCTQHLGLHPRGPVSHRAASPVTYALISVCPFLGPVTPTPNK